MVQALVQATLGDLRPPGGTQDRLLSRGGVGRERDLKGKGGGWGAGQPPPPPWPREKTYDKKAHVMAAGAKGKYQLAEEATCRRRAIKACFRDHIRKGACTPNVWSVCRNPVSKNHVMIGSGKPTALSTRRGQPLKGLSAPRGGKDLRASTSSVAWNGK